MKDFICISLHCENGKPEDLTTTPPTPAVRATALCFAKCEKDCPKARAKFRITQWCWRIKASEEEQKKATKKEV